MISVTFPDGASRAYEANVQAINATRTMWNRALEIGR